MLPLCSWAVCVLLVLACASPCGAQSLTERVQQANAEASHGDPKRAAKLFERLSESIGGEPSVLYQAPRLCARAGARDDAFRALDAVITAGWKDILVLPRDTVLAPLHADSRWSGVAARATALAAGFDQQLRLELLDLAARDQEIIRERMEVQDRYGKGSPQADSVLATVGARLVPVQARFREIVAARGWPRRSVVANDGANAAWLVIQHDSVHQGAYLPLLVEAAEQGEASWADVAFLTDRVRYHRGEPQLYGTQAICDATTGSLRPAPLLDAQRVDERRAAVGLGPLAEYLAQIPDICKRAGPGT